MHVCENANVGLLVKYQSNVWVSPFESAAGKFTARQRREKCVDDVSDMRPSKRNLRIIHNLVIWFKMCTELNEELNTDVDHIIAPPPWPFLAPDLEITYNHHCSAPCRLDPGAGHIPVVVNASYPLNLLACMWKAKSRKCWDLSFGFRFKNRLCFVLFYLCGVYICFCMLLLEMRLSLFVICFGTTDVNKHSC